MILTSKHNGQIITDIDVPVSLRGCSNVQIRGGKFYSEYNGGIYIDRFTNNCVIDGVDIQADKFGIYLESSSHHNEIRNCYIHDCGKWANRKSEIPEWLRKLGLDKVRSFGIAQREGIAIDDSQDNVIADNTFERCALAGITLYRNCNEFYGWEGYEDTFERGEGANRNFISHNTFKDMKVGIWNRSRQYRDLKSWECGRATKKEWLWNLPKMPYQQFIDWTAFLHIPYAKKFYSPVSLRVTLAEDAAEDNVFSGNTFNHVRHPLIDGSL